MIAEANGQGMQTQVVEDVLTGRPMTEGYTPSLPLWATWAMDGAWLPQFYLLRDIELMMIHPMVRNPLNHFKSGIASVDFEITTQDPTAQAFLEGQCRRFWSGGVPMLQGGYEYGWIGAENLYSKSDDGMLQWDALVQFNPRDTYLLTQSAQPVGVRVKNVRDKGNVDLWLASTDVPAKALWYAHEPRYNQHYGQSQLLGAWRPWRRLAWKDGAETVADTGVYRFAYAGPVVRYPEEDSQPASNAPATSLDSQGRPRRYARDVARQIAEWFKAGAGVGLPSSKYPPEMGGGDKWSLELPKQTLNIDGLIAYIKHLWDQISHGIGVPPELMQAAETGSGYSGRKIPRDAFLMRNQRIADAIILLFVNQVLKPLMKWNFGHTRFEVRVKDMLKEERAAQVGKPSEDGAARAEGMPMGPKATGAQSQGQFVEPPVPSIAGAQFSIEEARRVAGRIVGRILGRAA